MENTPELPQASLQQLYDFAAHLLVNKKQTSPEVKEALIAQGLDEATANEIVENLEAEIRQAKASKAKKDMIYGALWCVGGIAATVADVGFIFWGAIVFGGIQFFRGVSNSA